MMTTSLADFSAGELPMPSATALGRDTGLLRWSSIGAQTLAVGTATGFYAAAVAWLGSKPKHKSRNAVWAGLIVATLGGALQFVASHQSTRGL